MKPLNSIHALLAALAVLLIGFYAIDLQPSNDKASVFNLPDFTATTDVKPASQQPINTLQDLNDAIVNIAEEAKPTVVTISVTQTVKMQPDPFSRFFGAPRGGREFQQQGLGSGVIVSRDGYILTNNHVVQDADEITVGLLGGKEYTGEVVGTDPQTDIAVVKIDAEKDLAAIEIGNSDNVRVGELVLAIGSPLGENLAHSVSMGIISAKERSIRILADVEGYENFIQTDAAINPGNSGGALVNMGGELIGINTAIASRSGGNQGIGFAIPINLAKNIMTQLIETGEVSRAKLGIYGATVDQTMARALDLDEARGVIISDVQEESPASEAGLQEGDIVVTLNGKPVEDYSSFRLNIASNQPGTEVTLGVIRDGEKEEIEVTLGELAPAQTASNANPDQSLEESMGFAVQDLTADIARQLDLDPGTEGVIVTNISRTSNAYRQGLRQGDVITTLNRQQVQSVSGFYEIMNGLVEEGNQAVLLHVIKRGGVGMFIAFEV